MIVESPAKVISSIRDGATLPDAVSETGSAVQDVLAESMNQPVLVDFWAPWCGPCKQLGPIIEKAVKAAKGKVKLVKMNIDEHPQIPGQMGIQSIPAVIAFVNGHHRAEFDDLRDASGLDVTTLGKTLSSAPTNVADALTKSDANGAIAALNAAFMTDGAIVRVADKATSCQCAFRKSAPAKLAPSVFGSPLVLTPKRQKVASSARRSCWNISACT